MTRTYQARPGEAFTLRHDHDHAHPYAVVRIGDGATVARFAGKSVALLAMQRIAACMPLQLPAEG